MTSLKRSARTEIREAFMRMIRENAREKQTVDLSLRVGRSSPTSFGDPAAHGLVRGAHVKQATASQSSQTDKKAVPSDTSLTGGGDRLQVGPGAV